MLNLTSEWYRASQLNIIMTFFRMLTKLCLRIKLVKILFMLKHKSYVSTEIVYSNYLFYYFWHTMYNFDAALVVEKILLEINF